MQVFKHYFEELEEESLRDNFVVVVSNCKLGHGFSMIGHFELILEVVICCTRHLWLGWLF